MDERDRAIVCGCGCICVCVAFASTSASVSLMLRIGAADRPQTCSNGGRLASRNGGYWAQPC